MFASRFCIKSAFLAVVVLAAQITQILQTAEPAMANAELPQVFKARYHKLIYNHNNVYTEEESEFMCNVGEWYIGHHEIGQARLLYERLRKSNRLTPYVLCGSAATYMDDLTESNDGHIAEKFLKQAIAIDKNCSRAYCRLAEIALVQDRMEAALELSNRALRCPEVFANSYLVKARALTMLKHHDQAYKTILEAEKHFGHTSAVYNTKGGILEQMGRNEEAAAAFRLGFHDHPSDWTQHQIINCLLKADKDQEALKESDKLISLVPGDADVFRLRSSVFKKLKNYPAALKDLSKCIDMEPSSVAYKERADLYNKLGQADKAKADLAAARKILE
ncbi:hypothetical protein BH11CYA1_BH11CYA1_16830 [soil metagenome]